ncbi:MAG: hypothetical protein RSD41_07165, partial [Kiritimatiellia bacterium]
STDATFKPTKGLAEVWVDGTTYTANFEKCTDLAYTVEYYYDDVLGVDDFAPVSGEATFEDAVSNTTDVVTVGDNESHPGKVKVGYQFDRVELPNPATIGVLGNVIKVYYKRTTQAVVGTKTWVDGGVGRPGEGDVSIALERYVAGAQDGTFVAPKATVSTPENSTVWIYTWAELPTHTTDGVL